VALTAAVSAGGLLSGAVGVTSLATAGAAAAGGGLCGLLYAIAKYRAQRGASGMSATSAMRASVLGAIACIAIGATGLGIASYVYFARAESQQRETAALLRQSQIGDLQAQRHVLDTLIALQKDITTLQDRVFVLERERDASKTPSDNH